MFSVYRKSTNKDDYIHYLSRHDCRTKSCVVIVFTLRAFRICSEEFHDEECTHVAETFSRLGYPTEILNKLKKKAECISRRSKTAKGEKQKYIVVPYSKKVEIITRFLTRVGVNIVNYSGGKVKETMTRGNRRQYSVYNIMRGLQRELLRRNCTGILKKRLKERQSDLRHHWTSNSLVIHTERLEHLPSWKQASVVNNGLKIMKGKR